MNILVCTSSDSSFNSIRPELEIYISMAKAGHNITLITHKNTSYNKRLLQHGITIIGKPIVKKLSLTSIKLIRRTVQAQLIDVVYATNSKSIPNAAFACIGLKVKLAVYRGTANGLYWHDPGNYLGTLHPRVDAIVCVSDYVYDYVSSKKTLKNKKIIRIYKGHELHWYNKPAADLSEFGINQDAFTVICVINARPHKGLNIILQACNLLADLHNLHLLLVGKGADREPYLSTINNNKMVSRIHQAGYRHDAPELIAASSILVQPSTSGEGLPRVILEALAYGTPVIASANKGSMEIIKDDINGYIVPLAEPVALATSIRKIYDSPQKLQFFSKHSKDILLNDMSHQLTTKKYIKFFTSLINSTE
ncbi:MAG: glycosyltransferase family 4 protein [Gammaproteobacteria bacterium]|nr:glycosyltransferase family 4 protein [Gammaproteobacteria bacterium]